MHPVLNNTKWEEIRLAMYELVKQAPRWRTLDLQSAYLSEWDSEWFYHFKNGGYQTIQWLEIELTSEHQRGAVIEALERIHVPGEVTEHGIRVFGYAEEGTPVEYLQRSNLSINADTHHRARPPVAPVAHRSSVR